MLLMYRIVRPVSHAAINLASVLDPAIVGWKRHLYAIVPPARWMQTPPKERRVLGHVAQSESAYACAMRGGNSGRPSIIKSEMLLFTLGRGPSGSSKRGWGRQ